MAEATELLTATIFVRQSKPDLWPATTKVLKKFSVKCLVSGELKEIVAGINSWGLPTAPDEHSYLREDGRGSDPRKWSMLGLGALKFVDTEKKKKSVS